jgi:amino acid adenylation domain-containing protein
MSEIDRLAALTPAERSALVARARAARSERETRARARAGHEAAEPTSAGPVPTTSTQRRVWFLERQREAGPSPYGFTFRVRIPGADPDALARAAQEALANAPALHLTFREGEDGAPIAVPGPIPAVERAPSAEAAERAHRDGGTDPAGALVRATITPDGALWFSYHHLVADGWSLAVLVDEVVARLRGETPPPPRRTWAEHAAREAQRRGSDAERAAVEAHAARLAGSATEPIELPWDRPRPATRSLAGHLAPVRCPDDAALRAVGAALGVTPFVVCLAAFAVLLSRYGRRPDLVIGVPVAARPPGFERVVGFFANTLPVPIRVDPREPLRALAARIGRTHLALLDAPYVPLERLVDAVRPVRSPSHPPLFQVLLSYEDLPVRGAEVEAVGRPVAMFDLVLTLRERGGRLADGALAGAADLFDAPTLPHLADHVATLLDGLIAAPDRPVGTVPHVSAAERAFLRQAGCVSAWTPPAPTFDAAFRAVAAAHPDRCALRSRDRALTYAELDRAVDRAAAALAPRLPPDRLAALAMPRSPDLVLGMLAALRLQAGFLVLDPDLAPLRRERILARSRPALVLDALPDAPGPAPRRPASEDQLAYAIFTSGSTGEPKGALLVQRGLMNHLAAKLGIFELGADAVVAQTAPSTFDIFVWQALVPLLAGGTTAILDDDEVRDLAAYPRALRALGVTVLELVPSHLGALLDVLDAEGDDAIAAMQGLSALAVTGEAVPAALADRWLRRVPGVPMINCYGPTECSDDITHHVVTAADAASGRVPIGRAVPGGRLWVVDEDLRPVGVGVQGELLAGGEVVGRGYADAPALTAAAFVPDPLAEAPGARAYRTGDQARLRHDGVFEFFGRRDAQVKIAGHRIELDEIDACLMGAEGTLACATVVARPDRGAPFLASFVRTRGDLQAARDHLAARLPRAMVPAHLVAVDALPVTPNGKVDRKELAARALRLRDAEAEDAAPPGGPVDEQEAALLAAVGALVGREGPSARDDFFEIGGDSLVSLRLVAAMRRRGFALHANDVFRHPTLGALARAMTPIAAGPREAWGGGFELPPIARWFLRQPCAAHRWWNQAVRLRLPGEARPHLQAAIGAVVQAHPLLRSRIAEGGGTVTDARPALVPLGDDGDLEPLHRAIDPAERPFLAGVREAAGSPGGEGGELEVALVAHHLVIDAASWAVAVDDLLEALDALADGRAPALVPEPPLSEVVDAVRARAGAAPSDVRDRWGQDLRAAEAFAAALPGTGPGREGDATTLVRWVSAGDVAALERRLRQDWRAELDEAVLAAWAVALADAVGAGEVALWVETHGRALGQLDLSRSVGWLAALHPVRLPGADLAGAVRAAKVGLRDPHAATFLEVHGAEVGALGVVFDHLGRLDPPAASRWLRGLAVERDGTRDPAAPRAEAVELESGILHGRLVLRVRCGAGAAAALERALDQVERTLLGLAAGEAVGAGAAVVASDFADAELDDLDLAALADHLAALDAEPGA